MLKVEGWHKCVYCGKLSDDTYLNLDGTADDTICDGCMPWESEEK